jgi:adenine specific DNA methylase Mod
LAGFHGKGTKVLNEGRAKTLNQKRENLALLNRILSEATRVHGNDWNGIERYIREQIESLPADQRAFLIEEMERILRFRTPSPGENPH